MHPYPVGNPLAAGTATRPFTLSCKVHAPARSAQGRVCFWQQPRRAMLAQLYGIFPNAWNGRFQRAARAISRLLMVTVYPQKERDQGTTGHQQLEGSVRPMARPPGRSIFAAPVD